MLETGRQRTCRISAVSVNHEKGSTMARTKAAVLGLNQGAKIAREFAAHEDVDLVAIAGFGDAAEQVACELDVPLYADFQDLLNQTPLDAVAIALPNQLHLPAVEASLEAGVRNILLEKPIASTVEDGKRIIELCDAAQATLLIGHHRRSSSRYLALRKVLESGRIGDIVSIQSTYAVAKPHEYFELEWHTLRSGGPLLLNAIHDFDDINYFAVDLKPTCVFALGGNSIRGNDTEDAVSALIGYEGGVTATYFISDGCPSPWNYDLASEEDPRYQGRPDENSLKIFGTKGSVCYPHLDIYEYCDGAYGWNHPLKKEHIETEINDPMASEVAHFVDLCQGRETTVRCSGEDALATLKVITAIFDSLDSHQPVVIEK